MALKVVTPSNPQITIADLRQHLRVTDTAEDSLILSCLDAAVGLCEHFMARSISPDASKVLELALDAFPAGSSPILLPMGPVNQIVSISYVDPVTSGSVITITNDLYTLDNYGEFEHWATPVQAWPASSAVVNAVKARYSAGDMPPGVRHALLLLVGMYYEYREAGTLPSTVNEIPFGVRSLLEPYVRRLGFA